MDFSYKNHTYIANCVKTSNAVYSLEDCLGQGGNGVVCSAANQATGESVAIKFLTNDRGIEKIDLNEKSKF